ncbi:MAG: tryptophan synthase subunit alpha [Sediminibacterium sp.]|nr:tryptophan synthase subunit alpha [Sediminibacterium sp.]MBP6144592.1 tryptophan synthase subunit alpha [Sediminibacterium sp.]
MSRLTDLFKQKNERVLNVYCTAGYPHLNSTLEVMASLQKNGANIIELGMPYSDPLADGEVIQNSSLIALDNGMTIDTLFEQLATMRQTIQIPVVLMGYMNPILQYGFEAFCKKAKAVGVDGLILPDLPLYEFEQVYGKTIQENELDFIFLVTPETPEARLRQLDHLSTGFLYAVSSSATTGTDKDFTKVALYLERLRSMELKNPLLVGFGIKDKESFDAVTAYANGAIIGSAYIQALSKGNAVEATTAAFLKGVLGN